MKLVTYALKGKEQLALLIDNKLYDTNKANNALPATMKEMLDNWETLSAIARKTEAAIKDGTNTTEASADFSTATIMAPVPKPTSCRDGYAFRQHVAAARRNRRWI